MNKTFITGNLTKDPELRTANTRDGQVNVCNFTVAVNRRNGGQNNDADFFKVTTWRGLADNCAKYLAKGRKVAVTGTVSASAYIGNDGQPRARLEINADDVEFLSPKQDVPGGQSGYQNAPGSYQGTPAGYQSAPPANQTPQRVDQQSGFVQVDEEELPF